MMLAGWVSRWVRDRCLRPAFSRDPPLADRSRLIKHAFDRQDGRAIRQAGGSQRAQTLSHADRHGAILTGYHNGSHR